MEGTSDRATPRMLIDAPVEIGVGAEKISITDAGNNLSVGGLFVHCTNLPQAGPVHIRISAHSLFEADGEIRSYDSREGGTGIEFAPLSAASREALDDLIEDLTRRGLPAA
jgi:hypothetical protein